MISIHKNRETVIREWAEDDIIAYLGKVDILYVTAILNPFGPTLCVYYIHPGKSKLFELMVHPLEVRVTEVGEHKYISGRNELKYYADFFERSMPNIFMKGNQMELEFFEAIMGTYMDMSKGALKAFLLRKRFGRNIGKRLQAETKLAMEGRDAKDLFKYRIFDNLFKRDYSTINKSEFTKTFLNEQNTIEELVRLVVQFVSILKDKNDAPINTDLFIRIVLNLCNYCGIEMEKLAEAISRFLKNPK